MDADIMRAEYTAGDGQEVLLTPEAVARYVVAPNTRVTEQEMARFLGICKARGLNPFAGDCHLVKYGDGPASVIVGKDFYVRTACEQPAFDGFDAGVVVMGADGRVVHRDGAMVAPGEQLLGGWATVYDKARGHPVKAVVSLAEYSTGRSMWRSKPATMVRKVALVQALRESYPERFQGTYDADEMGEQGEAVRRAAVEVEPVFEDAPQAAPEPPGTGACAQSAPGARPRPQPAASGFSEGALQAMADMARVAAQACGADEADAKRAVFDAVRGVPDRSDNAAVLALASRAAREFRERAAAVAAMATATEDER